MDNVYVYLISLRKLYNGFYFRLIKMKQINASNLSIVWRNVKKRDEITQ